MALGAILGAIHHWNPVPFIRFHRGVGDDRSVINIWALPNEFLTAAEIAFIKPISLFISVMLLIALRKRTEQQAAGPLPRWSPRLVFPVDDPRLGGILLMMSW